MRGPIFVSQRTQNSIETSCFGSAEEAEADMITCHTSNSILLYRLVCEMSCQWKSSHRLQFDASREEDVRPYWVVDKKMLSNESKGSSQASFLNQKSLNVVGQCDNIRRTSIKSGSASRSTAARHAIWIQSYVVEVSQREPPWETLLLQSLSQCCCTIPSIMNQLPLLYITPWQAISHRSERSENK